MEKINQTKDGQIKKGNIGNTAESKFDGACDTAELKLGGSCNTAERWLQGAYDTGESFYSSIEPKRNS